MLIFQTSLTTIFGIKFILRLLNIPKFLSALKYIIILDQFFCVYTII